MLSDFDPEEAHKAAEEDWEEDSGGEPELSFHPGDGMFRKVARQGNGKCRAFAETTFYIDRTTVIADDFFDGGQSDPVTVKAAGMMSALEGFENDWDILFGDT